MLKRLRQLANLFQGFLNRRSQVYYSGSNTGVSGERIDEHTALTIPVVYSCVKTIIESISLVKFKCFNKNGMLTSESNRLNNILNISPDGKTTSFEFYRNITYEILMRGNSFYRIRRNFGALKSIEYLPVEKLSFNNDGNPIYIDIDGGRHSYRDVLHFKNITHGGERILGISPIDILYEVLSTIIAANKYIGSFYTTGFKYNGYIYDEYGLKPEALKDLRKQLEGLFTGRKAQNIIHLPLGAKFHNLQLSPKDTQFVELQTYSVQEVARIFKVPLYKLKLAGNISQGNHEQDNISYISDTVNPITRGIADEVILKVFGVNSEYIIKRDFTEIEIADKVSFADYLTKITNQGIISSNESRDKLGYEHVKDGDSLLQPLNNLNNRQMKLLLNQKEVDIKKQEVDIEKVKIDIEKIKFDMENARNNGSGNAVAKSNLNGKVPASV